MKLEQGAELKVRKMFDRHVHLRNMPMMHSIVPYTVRQCSGAIVMPNTKPIINTIEWAKRYKEQIDLSSFKFGTKFTPYLTLYLTDNTNIKELEEGYKKGIWIAGKLYPKGATTNSKNGVTNIQSIYLVLEKMQDIRMPALFHCEETNPAIDFFDRERKFIRRTLYAIRQMFPELKIVFEHISTKEAVEFVIQEKNTWATVTPHHLMKTCNAMFENGFDSTYFCYPILNSYTDKWAIINAVTSEDKEIRKKFGAGTDSAPHYLENKNKIGGVGGIFTAPNATEVYTQIFVEENAKLGYLNDFLAENLLKDVYGIKPTRDLYTTLVKKEWTVPIHYDGIRPFMADEALQWKIKS